MERVVHTIELLIAAAGIIGAIIAAWITANIRINTNKERIRAMELRVEAACEEHDSIKAKIDAKADKESVSEMKADLLRELGGKIDGLYRLLESIAKKRDRHLGNNTD